MGIDINRQRQLLRDLLETKKRYLRRYLRHLDYCQATTIQLQIYALNRAIELNEQTELFKQHLNTNDMNNIDVTKLTAEERKAMLEALQAEEAAEKERQENEIKTYKKLVSDTVKECFPKLEATSQQLVKRKKDIREAFNAVLALKAELYEVKDGQISHQFMDDEGKYRIRLGYHTLDNYDDTADAGIAMVKEYLSALGDSKNAQQAVDLALSLLAKDKKGTLKAARIMTLRKHALESGSEKFIKGVEIIMNAYRPIESKQFIRAEYRNEEGAWITLPLGMTEAE